jgi:predicted site-specific integrase-resolvase
VKLSTYAKKVGVHYATALRWFHAGKLKNAYQLDTGTIIVEDHDPTIEHVVIYARVSSSENRNNLETQASRLEAYAIAKGYQIDAVVKEIGSGINDKRKKLLKLLSNDKITCIIVEHKDRLTRFGFNYIETLLKRNGCRIEIVNKSRDGNEGLMEDLVSIITSFCARYYGLRRGRRKTENIIKELQAN